MGSVVLLDDQTINKIAAGEVVDRPSSIVKELVENSIDAKAKNVTVEIKNGGIKYIKITDDGMGFASDDVELAFERHATSKIRKEEDLLKITSMGFRGEALASIAAISRVDLVTRNINENIGTHVKVENGEVILKEEAASTVGSRIEIRDVFYNVPARFKFLKKDFTEAGYIEDVITRIALANPQISIKYINNGKQVLHTSGNGDLRKTIYDIFGKEVYENVIEINYELNNIKLTGMIGMPLVSRSTRMHQFTYINNRYIKDKTISSAIDKACEEKYAINKYAFIVLNLSMNPATIDVNVHPAKLEVKFDDESKVFDAVYHGVKNTLVNNSREKNPFTQIHDVQNEEKINQISKDIVNNGMLNKPNFDLPKKFDFNSNKENNRIIYSSIGIENPINPVSNKIEFKEQKNEEVLNSESLANNDLEEKKEEYIPDNKVNEEKINSNENKQESFFKGQDYEEQDMFTKKEAKPYKYIGNIFDTYIIIQMDNKMFLIDQHAAHERYLYEQIKANYNSKDRQTQLLLVPLLVQLSAKEKEVVDQNKEYIEKTGFIIEEFGENAIKISGVPNIGYDIEYSSMFKDIIDDILGAPKTQNSQKEYRFLATLACKAAVKGGMKLDVKEQIALVDSMSKIDNPFNCPHGRPTAFEMTRYEIERRFLRK